MSRRSHRRRSLRSNGVVAALPLMGVLGGSPGQVYADLDYWTAAPGTGPGVPLSYQYPWPGSSEGPPLVAAPRVDTVDTIAGTVIHDAPGAYTSLVGENFWVTAQTFTATSAFKLGQLSLFASGGTQAGLSIHLFDLGTAPQTAPTTYNLSTANGGQPTPDLLGGGSGLGFSFSGAPNEYVNFALTGADQVNLQAGHLYAFEQWNSGNQNGAFFPQRLGGASVIPPPDSDGSSTYQNGQPAGNPYIGGDGFTTTTGTSNTIVRNQLTAGTAPRDMILAVYDTSTLPKMQIDINGGATTDSRPTQDNGSNFHGPVWRSWINLPTSGNGGSGPQNGYGTVDTITKTFAVSGIANSPLGGLKATLHSADIGDTGGGTPGYTADGPLLNSHDWSLAGREFDNSGNWTPTKDYTYRDFAFAEIGNATTGNGTAHRMEVTLEGLDPKTTYAIKMYSYDNTNRLGVSVFTDVTKQPLVFMPSAFSANGAFSPGDGSAAGTQYAPNGQTIDGYNNDTNPTYPTTDDFRAVTLYATTDANGKLVFAETTVTGLFDAVGTQTLPVLNGFEINKAEYAWSGGTGTNWGISANWTGGNIPNAKGQAAVFGTSANTSVTLDSAMKVGRLVFNGSSYTIGGASTLTLDDTSLNYANAGTLTPASGNGRTSIELTSASAAHQTINAPVVMNKDTEVNTATADQTLTLSQFQPSAVILSKTGAGTLEVNNARANGLRIVGGTVKTLANAGPAGVSVVGNLSIGAGAKLDLNNNKLITKTAIGSATGGVYNGVSGMIQSGRNGGGWTGSGIVTSQSAATGGSFTSIGVATAQQAKGLATATMTAVWAGQTVTGSDTLVMYTYGGDANLDGKINVDDYGHIDSSIPLGISGWFNGDFNYDGKINVDDYGIIDSNVPIQGAPFPTGAGLSSLSAVPEPASVGILFAACGVATVKRRRRKQESGLSLSTNRSRQPLAGAVFVSA